MYGAIHGTLWDSMDDVFGPFSASNPLSAIQL